MWHEHWRVCTKFASHWLDADLLGFVIMEKPTRDLKKKKTLLPVENHLSEMSVNRVKPQNTGQL